MTLALMLAVGWLAAGQSQPATSQVDPKLIRVYVHTDDGGEASELRDRQASVKDLSTWLSDKKKDLVLVDDEDRADVSLEVTLRWVTTPSVVVGLAPRPGQPSTPATPARVAHVRVRLTHRDRSEELTNKNTPFENVRGWQAAAEDVAKQAHKWMTDRRAAILVAR